MKEGRNPMSASANPAVNSHAKTHHGSVCILPDLSRHSTDSAYSVGGPVSFHGRLIAGLQLRGVRVTNDPTEPGLRAILVIGGISRLDRLFQAKRRGVRIVQRLNGMNWIHRKRPTGLKLFLKSEYNNWILATIRRRLADRVVYQSNFAKSWWGTVRGAVRTPSTVIYNGVDLQAYHPDGPHERPTDHIRLLLVEGHLGGGNEQGLDNAVQLAQALGQRGNERVELVVVGDVPETLREQYNRLPGAWINWAGVVSREHIPFIDRSAHLLFSADLNAACPNSVIEAMACGLPVIAFATGSLPELLEGGAGRVVPYGSNYWNLEPPDIQNLATAARSVLADQETYRQAARARAEQAFDVDQMVEAYLKAMLD
jgi:glycosyltransferase involved in cell wall biosynthesis